MVSMLEGVITRGTGRLIGNLGFAIAGKTGTTNDNTNAWFIGFTPDLVVGVYVGFDTPNRSVSAKQARPRRCRYLPISSVKPWKPGR